MTTTLEAHIYKFINTVEDLTGPNSQETLNTTIANLETTLTKRANWLPHDHRRKALLRAITNNLKTYQTYP